MSFNFYESRYLHIHTYMHTYMHTCMLADASSFRLDFCRYLHIHIHTYMHTYISTYTYACIHTYMQMPPPSDSTSADIYIYIYIHACMHNIYIYMHTYIHTYIHTCRCLLLPTRLPEVAPHVLRVRACPYTNTYIHTKLSVWCVQYVVRHHVMYPIMSIFYVYLCVCVWSSSAVNTMGCTKSRVGRLSNSHSLRMYGIYHKIQNVMPGLTAIECAVSCVRRAKRLDKCWSSCTGCSMLRMLGSREGVRSLRNGAIRQPACEELDYCVSVRQVRACPV